MTGTGVSLEGNAVGGCHSITQHGTSMHHVQTRRVGGTDTGPSVPNRLVRYRKVTEVEADHFGFDLDGIEGLWGHDCQTT